MSYIDRKFLLNDKTVIIRNAVLEDKNAIIDHYNRASKETDFLMSTEGEFNVIIPQEKDNKKALFLVVECDDKIVGSCFIFSFTKRRMRHMRGLAIAIEREFWGLGLGKLLIRDSLAWADANDEVVKVTLEVDTDNYKAVNLYHKLGFEIEGTIRDNKILANGKYKSGYLMGRIKK